MAKPTVTVRYYPKAGGVLRFTAINAKGEPIHESECLIGDVARWVRELPTTATHLPITFYDGRDRPVALATIHAAFPTPTLAPVASSNLAAVGYDPATATLYVEFKGGALYAYDGVPPAAHAALVAAPSAGGYLNREVKGAYPYRRLTAALEAA